MAEGRSLQQSINFVGDLIKQRFDAWVLEKRNVPSWSSKIDPDVTTYLTSMEQWIIGYFHWSFATDRYFGTAAEEVKKTGVVMLLPQKAK